QPRVGEDVRGDARHSQSHHRRGGDRHRRVQPADVVGGGEGSDGAPRTRGDEEVNLDAGTTALVLIDLQRGIVTRDTKPHTASDVVARGAKLARRFRELDAPVVLVHVGYSADDGDRLQPMTDAPPAVSGALPPDWSELVPELEQAPNDIVVLKRQWGAFYGTQLDLQLRRRNVRSIVI